MSAPTRIWLVGFGTVGRWLARALHDGAGTLAERYGITPRVVAIANAGDGFVYREAGFDLGSALEATSLAELDADERYATAIEGLRATDADVLVEVSASPAEDGEPGLSHIREALGRGIGVATSNKWPVALDGVGLAELARRNGAELRAESTVMSGTPVLRALTDGLAGAEPVAIRGVLNATVNFILTRMGDGRSYEEALAEAQAAGLAERDPAADVDGHDSVAKLMILAALVFGRQLGVEEVGREGIAGTTLAQVEEAAGRSERIRELATLEFAEPGGRGELTARGRAHGARRRRPTRTARGHAERGHLPRLAARRGERERSRRGPGARRPGRARRPDLARPHVRSPVMEVPPEHRAFAADAERSLEVDPMPTLENLSRETGVPVDTLVHHALVRWTSAGAEALMAVEPQALRDLIAARKREDWASVAGIVDWLEAGSEGSDPSG